MPPPSYLQHVVLPAKLMSLECICLQSRSSRCVFEPVRVARHQPGEHDVTIDVKFCGVCHSDVHVAKNDFLETKFPVVPGHEIAGVVAAVGARVTKFRVGDHVGVGFFVDSCLECAPCKRGDEHFCSATFTPTFNGKPAHGRAGAGVTKGGYSTAMVVDERFAIALPKALPLERAGPLLCAGVTMYAPLVKWRVGPGSRVGINGLGGLGTIGVKLAKALGAHVTVITRSARKERQARAAGADAIVLSSDAASIKAAARSLDLVVDTVSVRHDLKVSALAPGGLIDLLAVDGVWCYCGLILDMLDVQPVRLLQHQLSLTATQIGGIALTQRCVDFCAKHAILPEVEVVEATPAQLSAVYEKLDGGNDAGVRYVLDIGNTLNASVFEQPRARAPKLVSGWRVGAQIALILNRAALARIEEFVLEHTAAIAGGVGAALFAAVAAFVIPPLASRIRG